MSKFTYAHKLKKKKKQNYLVVLGRQSILEKLIASVSVIIIGRSFKMHRKDPQILKMILKNLVKASMYKRLPDMSSSSFIFPGMDHPSTPCKLKCS